VAHESELDRVLGEYTFAHTAPAARTD